MNQRAGPPPVERRSTALTVQEKATNTLAEVVAMMNRADRNQQLRNLLGSDAAVEAFKTVALHALASNESVLANCTPASIIEAVRESAVLGLQPTGLLGEGWILPFGSTAKFMPGYRGYIKLLRNSGQVQALDCQVVRARDEFAIEFGTAPRITHRIPRLGKDEDRGDFEGAYAWVRFPDGELVVEWMSLAEIYVIQRRSPSVRGNRPSPWDTDWSEMARKTVIRRLVKRLPLATADERLRELQRHEAEVDESEGAEPKAQGRTVANLAADAALAARGIEAPADPSPPTTSQEPPAAGNGTQPLPVEAAASSVAVDPVCGKRNPHDAAMRCGLLDGHGGEHRAGTVLW